MKNYVGNKGGQTILPILANFIVKSKRYFSLFYGGGGLETSAPFRHLNWVVSDKKNLTHLKATAPDHLVYSSYQDLVGENSFTSADFIFCDPPYLFETRKSKAKIYEHEFLDQDHVEFLNCIVPLKAKILITHPKCELYDKMLIGWSVFPFSYMTRGGMFNDCIYYNFSLASVNLITYEYLGFDHTQRQQIKRKRSSLVGKIHALPMLERKALFKNLLAMYGEYGVLGKNV